MVTSSQLFAAVAAAFVTTSRGLQRWPDPHPDRRPLDAEYSRLSDPAKWRILGCRADAWTAALTEAGLAVVERGASIPWQEPPGPQVSRIDRVLPRAAGALPMVLARTALGHVDDAGLVVGVQDGTTAVAIERFPDCGCDACDSGSQNELDHLDRHLRGIVTGTFRRLTDGSRTIVALDDGGWSGSGHFERGEIDTVLRDPGGWRELTGASWVDPSPVG